MKKIFLIWVIALFAGSDAFSQFKEYKKLSNLFKEEQYEKCLEQALKYNKKESKELQPVLFASKAYFELYKKTEDKEKLSNIKGSLKFAAKLSRIDKKKEATESYVDFLEILHKEALDYGGKIYYSDVKDKSRPIFDQLAKIYKDTTAQYYDFHPEKRKKIDNEVGINVRTKKVNQLDEQGRKQGFWSKVYPNGALAYEIHFKDDKPDGKAKRYHENGKIMAVLNYDDRSEWSDAKLYDENGNLSAAGKYKNKQKENLWVFYSDSFKIAEENYLGGKKNGVSKTYYNNGKVSEEKHWEDGTENGVWRQYFKSGKKKLETNVTKGVRNSVYYTYHENGRFETKGHYKNDHMDGDWFYYDASGEEIQKINYVMGKTDKQKELDEKESEILDKLDKNKHRLVDPAKFINNPNEYLKKNR